MKKIVTTTALIATLLTGCQTQKQSQEAIDFHNNWITASLSERNILITKAPNECVDIINGYLIGKDRAAAEEFLGNPTSEIADGMLEYRTSGRARIWVHFDENKKINACNILK
ncbi:MAG: hypothetical protein JXR23_05915 [Pontiellaceae bacterium]|nr:hypothetical protein [Pontiellaceae bacterium]